MDTRKEVTRANIASGLALAISLSLAIAAVVYVALYGRTQSTTLSAGAQPPIILRDTTGQARLEIGLKPGGEPFVHLLSTNGRITAALGLQAGSEEPVIAFFDPFSCERLWGQRGATPLILPTP